MSPTPLLLALAAVTVVVAVRQAVRSRRRGDAAWRLVVLVAGQFALAALLAMFLFPPARGGSDGTLVVLTADSPRPPAGAGADHVALPEAPTHPGIARVPDLGTALRRHPGTRAIRVVGAGLPARDRDAALGVRVVFEPAPLPAGVVALHAPVRVGAGRRFTVTGRVHGAADARMELLDPAGRRVARVPVAADGGFAVSAIAGPAGSATWTLRHRDAADAVAGTIGLPVEVVPGAPLRILALAGGIGPEQKYLARWALDAGLSLQARANVGGGVDIGGAVPPLSPDGLREVDGVILDDRAWRSLGAGGRAALLDAVRDGVGVLVRLTGDPGAADREAWAAWGFTVARADIARDVTLAEAAIADASPVAGEGGDAAAASGASVDAAAARHAPVTLSRRAVAITAADGAPLLRDAEGTALAVWRAEGRGRIAVWNLSDTFRLQLAGRRAAYGSLWAEATGTLARARDDAASDTMPRDARVGARLALCGLGDTRRAGRQRRRAARRSGHRRGGLRRRMADRRGLACAARRRSRGPLSRPRHGRGARPGARGDARRDPRPGRARGRRRPAGRRRAHASGTALAVAARVAGRGGGAVVAGAFARGGGTANGVRRGSRGSTRIRPKLPEEKNALALSASIRVIRVEKNRLPYAAGSDAASSAASSGETPGIFAQSMRSICSGGRKRRA